MKISAFHFVGLLVLAVLLTACSRAESAASAWDWIDKGVLVIDVRTEPEFKSGHIEGALNIPYEQVDVLVAAIGEDASREVVLYCRSGRRSGIAMKSLQGRGYERILNAGGYRQLIANRPAKP